ncbi:hypothetical protein HYV43_05630 [Candidatus Micrarchaeota archaeon]|nr:hypothetical protein [Candidatus Micrarchaeota archaeon]
MALFLLTGQVLAWAFLSKFSWPVKIGAGLLASVTVPALLSTALNWVGVPFNPLTVYAVFLVLLAVGAWVLWQKRQGKK